MDADDLIIAAARRRLHDDEMLEALRQPSRRYPRLPRAPMLADVRELDQREKRRDTDSS